MVDVYYEPCKLLFLSLDRFHREGEVKRLAATLLLEVSHHFFIGFGLLLLVLCRVVRVGAGGYRV